MIGIDFGTLSARGVLVDPAGKQIARCERPYASSITTLPDGGCVMNDPQDWLDAATQIIDNLASRAHRVQGVGVAFTSCTVLPVDAHGTPVCSLLRGEATPTTRPHAFPKLWKHHSMAVNDAADALTMRIKTEPFMHAYGGRVGLEWFHPKLLEVYTADRDVFRMTAHFLEAGDWLVWRLCAPGAPLMRSTCNACYKGLWDAVSGRYFVSADALRRVGNADAESLAKMLPTKAAFVPPGTKAGAYNGIPVGVCMIDAHAAALYMTNGQPNVLALLLGTSGCWMVSSATQPRAVAGIAGVALNGIAPGLFGIETGCASVGDSFAWLASITRTPLAELEAAAASRLDKPATVSCIDFFNGNRTPLMRGDVKAAFEGIALQTTSGELYLAIAEAVAFGVRLVVELLAQAGVRVDDVVVGGGGLASRGPCCRLIATALAMPVRVCDDPGDMTAVRVANAGPSRHGQGAAMLAAMASGAPPNWGPPSGFQVDGGVVTWASAERYERYRAGVMRFKL